MLVKYSYWDNDDSVVCTELAEFKGLWYKNGICTLGLGGNMIDILYKVDSIEYTSMLTSIYNAVESGRGIVSIDKLGIEDDDDREDEETNKLFEAI